MKWYYIKVPIRGSGGIGRRAGLRILWPILAVRVQVPPSASQKHRLLTGVFYISNKGSSVIQNTGLARRKHDILILTIGGPYALSALFSRCFRDRLFADQI